MTKKTIKSPEQKPIVAAPKHPCMIDKCGKESSVAHVTSVAASDPIFLCESHYKSWCNNHRPYFLMNCPCCGILIIM